MNKLSNIIKSHFEQKTNGFLGDWCWSGFAFLVNCMTFLATYYYGINMADGASSIATGMFALMSIGASSVLASAPRFLVLDFKSKPQEEAKEKLRSFIHIQWSNLKILMVCAIGTMFVALLNSAIGDMAHLNIYQGYVSSILPGLVIVAIRRWWLLTKELLAMVSLYVEDK